MRRLIISALALAGAGILAGSAAPTHGRNFWSGQWNTGTGALALQWATDAEGAASIRARGGRPCAEPTDYFTGSYRTTAGDSGKVTGCTVGGRRLVARWTTNFPANNRNGTFVITYSNNAFSGRFQQDGGGSGAYTGRFSRHFIGDGAEKGGRAAGEGRTYSYSFRGYANNVKVVSPLVGPWQLGYARIKGAGKFEVHEGKFVGNPGTVTVSHDPHSPRYTDRWLKAKVIGFLESHSPPGHVRDYHMTLKIEVIDSKYPDEECRPGLIGKVVIEDTDAVLSNRKKADYITIGNWQGKCPTFTMGFFNTDGGARTDPTHGGPPDGGQFAIVSVKITE